MYYRSPLNKGDRSHMPADWTVTRHLQIEHSGHVFNSCIWSYSAHAYVWPIEEYLCRTNHTKSVAERIERLNPLGKPEGERPKGWNPKFSPRHVELSRDLVPAREYQKKWGRKPERIAFKRGRHKFVTRADFVSGPNGD